MDSPSLPTTFKDKAGREWPVKIGLAALARLRKAGIPLEEFVPMPSGRNAKASAETLSELIELLHGTFNGVQAVMAILQPELSKEGITDEAFLESVDDEQIIVDIGRALYQAIHDFFQKSPLRQSLVKQAWRQGAQMMAAAARRMDRVMEKTDVMAKVNQAMDKAEEEMMTPTSLHEPGKNSAINTPA